jgi:mRNA interferase MazF
MANPNRGEVWLVDLGYAAKVRPCLVLSIPAEDEDRALATLVPHTTALRGSRFEVELNIKFLRKGGFDAQNLVTIPHAKLIRRLGKLTDIQLGEVEERIRFWLGL